MREKIIHELEIICRAHGFNGDPSRFLAKSPQWIASGLQQLGVDPVTVGIVASWDDTLSSEEVLSMLRDINDKGSI